MSSSLNHAIAIGGEERHVTLTEVNMAEGFIEGIDTFGTFFRIVQTSWSEVAAIPQQGEIWIIKRYKNQWRLFRRLETGDEDTPITNLQPGDRRLEAQNILYLNAQQTNINSPVNIYVDGILVMQIDSDGNIHIQTGKSIVADL